MTIDLDILTRPFPENAVKQRSGGGNKMLDYVEGHTVILRLNEATENEWNLEVKSISRVDLGNGNSLMTAHVALTIPTLGTREHIGVQKVSANGGEDLVKGCVTDALKKAATLFGVGLELYGPDYEAGEVDDAPRQARPVQRTAAPARQQSAPAANNGGTDEGITPGQSSNLYRLFMELGRIAANEGSEYTKDMYRAELEGLGFPRDDRRLSKTQASAAIRHFKILAGEPVDEE